MSRAVSGALAVVALLFTGAALAAPVDVLRIVHESGETVELETAAFRYEFTHSVFQVPTSEEFVIRGGRLQLVAVRSTDRRVFEYQRWAGEPREAAGGTLLLEPPPTELEQLRVRIASGAGQRIVSARRVVELETTFGDGVVSVFPATSNRAQWLVTSLLSR